MATGPSGALGMNAQSHVALVSPAEIGLVLIHLRQAEEGTVLVISLSIIITKQKIAWSF